MLLYWKHMMTTEPGELVVLKPAAHHIMSCRAEGFNMQQVTTK